MQHATKTKDYIEKITRSELKKIRERVRNYIEGATLSLIGLEKRYSNSYEIDHCNGRSSILTDAFKRIATEEAEKIARTYKPTKEDLASWQKAFESEIKNQMKYKMQDLAKIKAEEISKEYVAKIKIDVDKILEEELETQAKNLPF